MGDFILFYFFVPPGEQSVLLSSRQTLAPPPLAPPAITMIPGKLICLSRGEFVQIKPFKADACRRRRTTFAPIIALFPASVNLFFIFYFFLNLQEEKKLFPQ